MQDLQLFKVNIINLLVIICAPFVSIIKDMADFFSYTTPIIYWLMVASMVVYNGIKIYQSIKKKRK